MIYRITESPIWAEAQRQGWFASPDLSAEGFIHFSERHQVAGVAQRYYSGKTGLLLLAVDDTRLPSTAVLKRENTRGGSELFPHVYGTVPLDLIVGVAPLQLHSDGSVNWPEGF